MKKIKVSIPRKKISAFCRRWKVDEFSFFGSVLREDFHSESDIDILVTFSPDTQYGLFDLVEMEDELKKLFGRSVDMVEKEAIIQSKNYIRRRNILENIEVIYAAG